jgi:AcrR family transcriptional regulator
MPPSTSPRPYRSALRDEQARATQRRIVAAGHDLFVEQGYAPTTIDAIAARAGVSRKTVFTSVGGKAAVLKLAWDWALAGDDEPVPMADRPDVKRMFEEPDPARLIEQWTRQNGTIACRLAPLFDVLTVAADGDPEAAGLQANAEANRSEAARWFVTRLAELGGLRNDLPVDRAAAIAELLMDPIPSRRLVLERGWTVEEYVNYVERMARAAFLP